MASAQPGSTPERETQEGQTVKRAIVLIGSLLLTLALGAPVGATHQGEGDRVFGSGQVEALAFEVSARHFTTGAAAGEVHGHVSFTNTSHPEDFTVSGEVVCVAVMGNLAAVVGRITQTSESAASFMGGTIALFLTDNGRSGTPPDEMFPGLSPTPPAPNPTCAPICCIGGQVDGDVRIEDNA